MLALEKGTKIKYIAYYYPQGNEIYDCTNKNLIWIIKRTITNHQRNSHNALFDALWADRVTPKATIGNSPLFLVYGKEAILPPTVFLPSLHLDHSIQEAPSTTMKHQIDTLLKLEEEWQKSRKKLIVHQALVNWWVDKKAAGNKEFKIGELVLKWDKAIEAKGKHTKLQSPWLRPFKYKNKLAPTTLDCKIYRENLQNSLSIAKSSKTILLEDDNDHHY